MKTEGQMTYVSAKEMLTPKQVKQPLDRWLTLNRDSWHYDMGLINRINTDYGRDGMGDYYARDKFYKPGWDLYLTMDDTGQSIFRTHYGLPDDLFQFLKWCYNYVAAEQDWKDKSGTKDQMNFFPYRALYKVYHPQ